MKIKPLILFFITCSVFAFECKEQSYIDSLDTKHYYQYWIKNPDQTKLNNYLKKLHAFRARNYGKVEGEPETYRYNKESVKVSLINTKFLNHDIKIHKKILKPLRCVEQRILKNCHNYRPKNISSYRDKKSYKRVISNHRFGIALDFDPLGDHSHNEGNPCCGPSCKESWRNHPICNGHDPSQNSPYNVSIVSECWVKAFEAYGFHWLINFRMHDTMHFEYLGDPTFWN